MSRLLVLIPTYNEIDNVKAILSRVKVSVPAAGILFIDDNSPDGTGLVLDDLGLTDSSVHVLHRAGKLGIGSAHLDGIAWAYDAGVDTLVTLDADCTHSPEELSVFFDAIQSAAVVVGSRFLKPEGIKQWPIHRRGITRLGHALTRTFLRMPYDATGAFRVYDLQVIPREVFALVRSTDYSFFYESLKILDMAGCTIAQVPVVLASRFGGNSKMKLRDIVHGVLFLLTLSARTMWSGSALRSDVRSLVNGADELRHK